MAELSPKKGGIGIPNIRTELVAMAATTVEKWATALTKRTQVAGTLLQSK